MKLFLILVSFNLFATELTLEVWNNLNSGTQASIMADRWYDGVSYTNLKLVEYRSSEAGVNAFSLIENSEHQALGKKLWGLMQDNIYMDNSNSFYIEDAAIVLVGGPYQSDFDIVYLIEDGKKYLLGFHSAAFEVGCEMAEYTQQFRFFKTEAEADASGCDFTDISWTAWATVNSSFKFLYWDEWMEWTGW